MKVQEINLDVSSSGKKQPTAKKKKKRNFLWLKRITLLILFGSAIILLALSPLFNIRAIDVQGNQHYQKDEIVKITDITMGKNGFKTIGGDLASIFTLSYRNSEKKIKNSLPYIKDTNVKFALPNKVIIKVTERKPVGIVPYLGTNIVIDEERYVLDTIDNMGGSHLPLIKGINLQHYEVGQELKQEESQNLDLALRVIGAVNDSDKDENTNFIGLIDSIDVSDPAKVCLLVDSRLTVNFGDIEKIDSNEMDYKIKFLKQIFTDNLNKEAKGLLDFTTGGNPNFIPGG